MSIDNNLPKLIISLDWLKIKISSSYGNLEALGSNLYSNPKLWNTFCKVVKLISDFPSISAEKNINWFYAWVLELEWQKIIKAEIQCNCHKDSHRSNLLKTLVSQKIFASIGLRKKSGFKF